MIIRIGLLCLLALAAVAAESPSGAQRAAQVAATLMGQPAPALQLRGVDGGTIDLGSTCARCPRCSSSTVPVCCASACTAMRAICNASSKMQPHPGARADRSGT